MVEEILSHVGEFVPTLIMFILVIALYKGAQILLTKKGAGGAKFVLIRQIIGNRLGGEYFTELHHFFRKCNSGTKPWSGQLVSSG